MMNFRVIEQALFDTIKTAAAGQWETLNYQRQRIDIAQVKGFKRTVEVFYREGDFLKSKGTVHGPKSHDPTYELMLFVSSPAQADIATLADENSNQVQIDAALGNVKTAAQLVKLAMNEFIDLIYQTVMSAATRYLGLKDPGSKKNPFDVLHIAAINVSDPHNEGENVVLQCMMRVTCTTEEDVTGITGTPAVSIDTDFSIEGDLGDNAGVATDPSS